MFGIGYIRDCVNKLNEDDFKNIMNSKKSFVKFSSDFSGGFSFIHYSLTNKSGVGLCDIDEVRDVLLHSHKFSHLV